MRGNRLFCVSIAHAATTHFGGQARKGGVCRGFAARLIFCCCVIIRNSCLFRSLRTGNHNRYEARIQQSHRREDHERFAIQLTPRLVLRKPALRSHRQGERHVSGSELVFKHLIRPYYNLITPASCAGQTMQNKISCIEQTHRCSPQLSIEISSNAHCRLLRDLTARHSVMVGLCPI